LKATLPEIHYLFTDCLRDYAIAKENGFKGTYLGAYPGGGGYEFEKTDQFIIPYEERNIILIKGYQCVHGKCIQALKSFPPLKSQLQMYNIIVFGASDEVFSFL